MSTEVETTSRRQIGHVLFIDLVGYSKLLIEEQRERQQQLNQIVRATKAFRAAEAQDKLVRLPTGDGMALVFLGEAEAPLLCAAEIAEAALPHAQLRLRMGVNTGPISDVTDVNDRANIAGAGINLAQRVMDVGDSGHILVSKRAAEDLLQYREWAPHFHDLGEVEVKHGVQISIVNFYNGKVGNPKFPDGLDRARKRERSRRRVRRISLAVTLILAGAMTVVSLVFWRKAENKAAGLIAAIPENSIAVLPFENLSDEKENAYFADGIQDDILTDLAKVADLKVISRTSVMQYRGTAKNLREIARVLQVAHVLEGSVRKIAGRVRVNAQLIDARSDAHLWAEHYDRDLADVFAIQSELAQRIVTQLKATLSPTEKAAIEAKPTSDLEAYDLYLRGKALYHNLFKSNDVHADLLKATELFEAAASHDRNFALAYCQVAQTHLSLYWFWGFAAADLDQAEMALRTALRLAPQLGEAHLAQADYYYHGHRDYKKALEELSMAERLLPNSAGVLGFKVAIARRAGHWDEALVSSLKVLELDPRSEGRYWDLIGTYMMLRRYPEAEHIADLCLNRIPATADFFKAEKAQIALHRGDAKSSRHLLETVSADSKDTPYWLARVAVLDHDYVEASRFVAAIPRKELDPENAMLEAFVLRKLGDSSKAESILLAAREHLQGKKLGPAGEAASLSWLALLDAALGRKEEALRESQRAVELLPVTFDAVDGPPLATRRVQVLMLVGERDRAIESLQRLANVPNGPSYGDLLSPVWDDLRADPRFVKISRDAARPIEFH